MALKGAREAGSCAASEFLRSWSPPQATLIGAPLFQALRRLHRHNIADLNNCRRPRIVFYEKQARPPGTKPSVFFGGHLIDRAIIQPHPKRNKPWSGHQFFELLIHEVKPNFGKRFRWSLISVARQGNKGDKLRRSDIALGIDQL